MAINFQNRLLGFYFLTALSFSSSQMVPDPYLVEIQKVNTRVTQVNATAVANKNSINSIWKEISRIENYVYPSLAKMNSSLYILEQQIVKNAATADEALAVAAGTQAELNSFKAEQKKVHEMWRKNFQVVKKTFTELRKKVKFPVPIVAVQLG